MNTNAQFYHTLAQFFLEWEMLHSKVVEKLKIHILCSVTVCRKSCRLWDNVEKYGRTGQATYDNRRMRTASWMSKATNTHSKYVILISFPLQQWLHESALMLRFIIFLF